MSLSSLLSLSSLVSLSLTIPDALAIQQKQVDHWMNSIPTDAGKAKFLASVAEANAVAPSSWRQVARGAEIERLYFLAIGKTAEEHQRHCASMD